MSAAAYGSVLVLAAIALLDAHQVSGGIGWEVVTGVGVATWVAHLYAEIVADHAGAGAPLRATELGRAAVDGLPIIVAAATPAVVLGLGSVGVLDESVALWMAAAVGVAQLFAVGFFVASSMRSLGQLRGMLSFAALTAAIGVAAVAVKLSIRH